MTTRIVTLTVETDADLGGLGLTDMAELADDTHGEPCLTVTHITDDEPEDKQVQDAGIGALHEVCCHVASRCKNATNARNLKWLTQALCQVVETLHALTEPIVTVDGTVVSPVVPAKVTNVSFPPGTFAPATPAALVPDEKKRLCSILKSMKHRYTAHRDGISPDFVDGYQQGLAEARDVVETGKSPIQD